MLTRKMYMIIYLLSTAKINMKKYLLSIVLIGLLGALGFFTYNSKQIPKDDFLAPGKSWQNMAVTIWFKWRKCWVNMMGLIG